MKTHKNMKRSLFYLTFFLSLIYISPAKAAEVAKPILLKSGEKSEILYSTASSGTKTLYLQIIKGSVTITVVLEDGKMINEFTLSEQNSTTVVAHAFSVKAVSDGEAIGFYQIIDSVQAEAPKKTEVTEATQNTNNTEQTGKTETGRGKTPGR